VVETDGEPYHLTPEELERDRLKDAYLQRHDIKVIRVTGFRFEHDRSGILDDLLALTKSARAA
jgi:very-short-patch-repair endonuclease